MPGISITRIHNRQILTKESMKMAITAILEIPQLPSL